MKWINEFSMRNLIHILILFIGTVSRMFLTTIIGNVIFCSVFRY